MPLDKELHPGADTIDALGNPATDAAAKAIDAILKANPLAKESGVVKLAAPAVVSDVAEREEVSKITTEAVDKDREVVLVKGIDLTHYRDNPVVLLNHDWHSLPLGKALWIKETGNGLSAKTRYAKRPSSHQGEWIPDSVYSLIQQGMMPGKSIGFLPLEARPPTKAEIIARPELKDTRRILSKSLLVEFSVVTIPSNSEALVESVGKSFPALAAVLGLATKSVEPDDVLARLEKYALTLPNPDELCETIAHVKTIIAERDQWEERFKKLEDADSRNCEAFKQIRRDFLGAESDKTIRPFTPKPKGGLYGEIQRLLKETA